MVYFRESSPHWRNRAHASEPDAIMSQPTPQLEFVELMDRLTDDVGRLRAELRKVRAQPPKPDLDEGGRRILRQQVSDHIQRINRLLGDTE